MTETLGASRASVRAAIRELVGIGVLLSEQGKGTYVINNDTNVLTRSELMITKDDCKDMLKVLEFRRIIESESCSLACRRAGKDNIYRLEKHLETMKKNVGYPHMFIKADMEFHVEVAKSTDNMLIYKTLKEIFEQTEAYHGKINEVFGYDGIMYHEQLLHHIKNNNGTEAVKVMHEHLQHAIIDLEKMQNQ